LGQTEKLHAGEMEVKVSTLCAVCPPVVFSNIAKTIPACDIVNLSWYIDISLSDLKNF